MGRQRGVETQTHRKRPLRDRSRLELGRQEQRDAWTLRRQENFSLGPLEGWKD